MTLWEYLLATFPDLTIDERGVCDHHTSHCLVEEEEEMGFYKTTSVTREMVVEAITRFYEAKGYRVVPGIIGGGRIERGKEKPWLNWVTTVSDNHILVSTLCL